MAAKAAVARHFFMNQHDINQQEWNNPGNWSLLCYHSLRDSRFLVPKRFGFGWTLNFGRKQAVYWFWGLMLIVPLGLMFAALAMGVVFHKR